MKTSRRRVLDFIFYALAGLAVVAFALIYAVHAARSGETGRLPLRWIGVAGATAVTFGYPVRWGRAHWRVGLFWLVLTGLLLVHLATYAVILLNVRDWPLILFAVVTPFEWLLICPALDWGVEKAQGSKRSSSARQH